MTTSKHEIGEAATLWLVGEPQDGPYAEQCALVPCHGGTALAWRGDRSWQFILADENGMPRGKGIFFSKQEAIDWCVAALTRRLRLLEAQIAALQTESTESEAGE